MRRPVTTLAAMVVLAFQAPPGAAAQAAGTLLGRVLDSGSGAAVADATVVLEGARRSALTDSTGTFRMEAVPAGDYELRIVHIAYGEHRQAVRLAEGRDLALLIRLSVTAIELEPVVVETLSQAEFDARSRGTRRNVITRDEIARLQDTGGHLGHILARHVPGIRLRTQQSRSGEPICLEFRSPASLLDPMACKPPLVFLDGARVSSAAFVLTTLPTEHVEEIEVVPPGEAGVAYGTDSRYGVILIETRTGASVLGEGGESPGLLRRGRYDWALEPAPHASTKVFAVSLLGTAAGIALGYAVGSRCLDFDGLSNHFLESECGSAGTAGARLAVHTLPQLGASLAARYAGSTEMSRGRLGYQLVAASLMAAPGVILSLTSRADGFTGSNTLGTLLLGLGVPMAATFADKMFRRPTPREVESR